MTPRQQKQAIAVLIIIAAVLVTALVLNGRRPHTGRQGVPAKPVATSITQFMTFDASQAGQTFTAPVCADVASSEGHLIRTVFMRRHQNGLRWGRYAVFSRRVFKSKGIDSVCAIYQSPRLAGQEQIAVKIYDITATIDGLPRRSAAFDIFAPPPRS